MCTGLYILWDASTIWGLMALRAAQAFALPCRLVKAQEIAQGLLSGKPPHILLVPGGSARLKCQALGQQGREAIRQYVAQGGHYLGFCGGAGLGLRAAREEEGLGLCPWGRATYGDRLQHLISGHACTKLTTEAAQLPLIPASFQQQSPALPVWWPGRFAPQAGSEVAVLARYSRPAADFWVADLPLASVPEHLFDVWRKVYGVDLSAEFLHDQPIIVHGSYGKGSYTLSYSHLETPASPQANAWLAHLLAKEGGLRPQASIVPAWEPDNEPVLWASTAEHSALIAARHTLRGLLHTGIEHNLFFRRTPWLTGWRAGIPGAALNSLYTGVCTVLKQQPSKATLACWAQHREEFQQLFPLFLDGAEGYLLAERLATTLAPPMPDAVSKRGLKDQREALFGHAMLGGGIIGALLAIIDELVYVQTQGTA
jgi:hypothetical protein